MSGVSRSRRACAPNAPARTATNPEIAPASAKVLSIDARETLDLPRVADEVRCYPARRADDDGAPRRRPEARDMEARHQPRHQCQRDAVHDQNEQPERQNGERERKEEQNRAYERVHEAHDERRHDESRSSGEPHAREHLVGDPQPERRDQQSDEKSSHRGEDNREARPATNRAVMPGLACTPSLASSRIAPLSESRPDKASDSPANGPRSAGQPLTMACSGWPNQLTASVSARGTRKTMPPRKTQSRPTTTVVVSSVMSCSRKRSLMPGAAGKVRVSPRATTHWP